MALIRVSGSHDSTDLKRESELILNTRQICLAYPDSMQRGCWVQMMHGGAVLVKMSFDELWTLIQRET
jgi:hypothetical protein